MSRDTVSFTRHLFDTLTYGTAGGGARFASSYNSSKQFNRFVQKVRVLMKPNKIEYLRVIEYHKDGTPHIHAVLQSSDVFKVNNTKYIDRRLYLKLQKCWKYGFSDPRPINSNAVNPVLYCLKYMTKNTTMSTVWRKMYAGSDLNVEVSEEPAKNLDDMEDSGFDKDSDKIPVNIIINGFSMKTLSWSRGFVFPRPALKSKAREKLLGV